MKKDNSNPKRSSSIISNEQEHIKKTASTTSSKSLGYCQTGNDLHIKQPQILSHSNKKDNEIIDDVKVAEIKKAIDEGRFKVNSEKIADRLLEVVKELIKSKRNK